MDSFYSDYGEVNIVRGPHAGLSGTVVDLWPAHTSDYPPERRGDWDGPYIGVRYVRILGPYILDHVEALHTEIEWTFERYGSVV